MSKGQRKYAREERMRSDHAQTCFQPDGSVQERYHARVQDASVDVNQIVVCPFCLQSDKLQAFLISNKKGISKSNAQCPKCQSGMRMNSLLRKWDAESFAEWVFEYSKQGYWQKVKFEEWKERLNQLGWGQSFWTRYRALKGENEGAESEESYADRMNRQGEEAARQWNEEEERAGSNPA
jgi:hypothetical protein